MIVDSTIADILLKIAKNNNIPSTQVLDILDAYYKGITKIITDEFPTTIKIDNFGKLIHVDRKKIQLEQKLQKENEVI